MKYLKTNNNLFVAIITMLLLLFCSAADIFAQTGSVGLEGDYFIRNRSTEHGQNHFNAGDFYMIPSSEYYNNSDNRYLKVEEKANLNNESVWRLISKGNGYYQILHVATNRYVVFKASVNNVDANTYQSVYLASSATAENNDENYSHFKIGVADGTAYFIIPRMAEEFKPNASFNPMGWGTMDMQLYDYHSSDGSQWYLEPLALSEGEYYIQNAHIYNNESYNGNTIVMNGSYYMYPTGDRTKIEHNIDENAKWTVKVVGLNYYQIIHNGTNKYLTVADNLLYNSGNNSWDNSWDCTRLSDNANNVYSHFKIGEVDKTGSYYIIPKVVYESNNENNHSLNPGGGGPGNLHLYPYNYAETARWKFITIESGGGTVTPTDSRYAFTLNGNSFLGVSGYGVTATNAPMNPNTSAWSCDGSFGDKNNPQPLYVVIEGKKYYLAVNGTSFTITDDVNGAGRFYLNNGVLSANINGTEYGIVNNNGTYMMQAYVNGNPANSEVKMRTITNIVEHEAQIQSVPQIVLTNGTPQISALWNSIQLDLRGGSVIPSYYTYNSSHRQGTTLYYYEDAYDDTNKPQPVNWDTSKAQWSVSDNVKKYLSIQQWGHGAYLQYTVESANDVQFSVTVTFSGMDGISVGYEGLSIKGTGVEGEGDENGGEDIGGGDSDDDVVVDQENTYCAPAGRYIIQSDGYYLAKENGNIVATKEFNPNTCIWNATKENHNGNEYLKFNNNGDLNINGTNLWRVSSQADGMIQQMNSTGNYLHFNGSNWVIENEPDGCATRIDSEQNVQGQNVNPQIGTIEQMPFDELRSYKIDITQDAACIPAYIRYDLVDGSHLYWVESAGIAYKTVPPSEYFIYEWSLPETVKANATIDQNGILMYRYSVESEITTTVTLSAQRFDKDGNMFDNRVATLEVRLSPADNNVVATPIDKYYFIRNFENSLHYMYPSDDKYNNGNYNLVHTRVEGDNFNLRNAVWIFRNFDEKHVQIIHAETGRFLVTHNTQRGQTTSVHLSDSYDDINSTLYEVGEYPTNQKIPYYIRPIGADSYTENNVLIEMGLNPYGGMGHNLSLYRYYNTERKGELASLWTLQMAKTASPVITTDGVNVSIICDTPGARIYFTTDGSEPSASSRLYNGTFPLGLDNTIKAIALADNLIESDVITQEFYRISSLDRIPQDGATGYYILMSDVDASGYTTRTNFRGVLDGAFFTIKNLQQPLFDNVVDAIIKNVVLDDVNIDENDGRNVGAIACDANGKTLIYNCGVLATNGSIVSGSGNVGSIVGQMEGHTRVANCYSYATVTGKYVGGIVGSNTATASTINYITTMIINCMFYGDLDGTSKVSPIYGGTEISNRNNLNTYSYYKIFDDNGDIKYDVTHNNNVMPITEDSYLDRFEFYRNILNSQRELASYFTFESLLLSEEIGKWVLLEDVAPYPVIRRFEKDTKKTLDRQIPAVETDYAGRKLRTVKATFIINGERYVVDEMPVTDMDTARWDYTYGKIVLPHANEFIGWRPIDAAYNTTDYSYIVSGWKVVSVDGITTIDQTYDFDFTNPKNKVKDIYSVTGGRDATFNPYVYAQGGNYVVPDNAKELVFEAHWAKCVYLSDIGEDVAYNPNFDEATQIGNQTWVEQSDVIQSASFRDVSYKDSWTINVDPVSYFNNSFTVEIFDNISHILEFFCWQQEFSVDMRQNIRLKPGTYMLRFYGFSRYGINEAGKPKGHGPNGNPAKISVSLSGTNQILAQDTLNNVYDHTSQEMDAVKGGYDEFNSAAANTLDGYVNSLGTSIIAFSHGYFLNELQFTIDTEQNIDIRLFTDGKLPAWSWINIRDMKLYRLKEDTFQDRTFENKKIYNSLNEAMDHLDENCEFPANQAVVLVGNYHLNDRIPGNSFADDITKAVTIMSIDKNNDQEPDYACYTYTSNPKESSRTTTPPLRWDFITAPGIGMAARVSGSSAFPGIGIWHTKGWFETTETYLGLHNEAEINPSEKHDNWISPWITNGGIFKQVISNYDGEKDLRTNNNGYIRMGGKVLVEQFHPGNHEEKSFTTYLMPVNVSGGEILECYMTGRAGSTDNPQTVGDVRFWSNGGYIHKFLGAYMAPVNGNVKAEIHHAIIDEFYGGGANANKPVSGNIDVTVNHSLVDNYTGGPMVGDMNIGTHVTTAAEGTTFGNYYGGGYGGTSLARKTVYDGIHKVEVSISDNLPYPASFANYVGRRLKYDNQYGVATDYGFEYFFAAGGDGNLISRFFVDYATLSLATVRSVTNNLTNCLVKSDFYGGGRQGYVDGNVTSVLNNTNVNGNAFGAGYTGKMINADVATETQPQYSTYLFDLGVITPFGKTEYETFTWQKVTDMNVPASNSAKKLYTTTDMSLMGKVKGDVSITITGSSVIGGNLFGGGNQADVLGKTSVIMPSAESVINGTVYGGGNESNIEGSTDVKITGGTINGDLFGGGNMGRVTESSKVYIGTE